MMGTPGEEQQQQHGLPPNSPAIPSEFETDNDVPSSPIAMSTGAASSDFGSTPAKSYTAFPKTPGSANKTLFQEAPSSRLRHSITMKKVTGVDIGASPSPHNSPIKHRNNHQAVSADVSFDLGLAGSSMESLIHQTSQHTLRHNQQQSQNGAAPKTGQVNWVTMREQEKVMDELRKENFDLKLRVSLLQDRLTRMTPENIETALAENVELRVKNEALQTENRTYKALVDEAHGIVEQLRMEQGKRTDNASGEVQGLRIELEQSQGALSKAQVAIHRYESQMSLFDRESREGAQRIRQLELDLNSAQSRLSDANSAIARYQADIVSLEEEVRVKSETVRKFRDDLSGSTGEISLFARQLQELQDRLKRSEAEKEELLREKDGIRRELEKAESHMRVNNTLSSPARNSLDVLESKLLRELGQAQRRVNDLEKQTNLSQGEREHLITQARKTGQDLMIGLKSMQLLAGKIVEVAFPGRELPPSAESLSQAVEHVEGLCRDVLVELEESRLNVRDLDSQVNRLSDTLNLERNEKEQLATALSGTEVQVQKLSLELNQKGSELRSALENNRSLTARIREISEADVPKWQREAERASERIRQLTQFLENYETSLKQSQQDNEDSARRVSDLQQALSRAQNEAAELQEQGVRLAAHREELVERLAAAESTASAAQKRLDEMQNRVGHSEKVKSAVEEQFNRELKALHAANGDLKGQLSLALSARTDLSQRIDRLSQLLREAEKNSEAAGDRSRSVETSLATLRREHEILILEHRTMESDLADKQAALSRLENELTRHRREDQVARRTHDGLEHLQAKVESLSAMNAFLKDQTETRERTIRSLEDRLRHQSDEMRVARDEVDAQSRKLKKRELLISQALKRLESINHLRPADLGLLGPQSPTDNRKRPNTDGY